MRERVVQSYAEAEHFLEDVPRFTKKNPMEDTLGFYEYIQQCENGRYREKNLGRVVHVAGTNGKGSVCAYLQSICLESGYRTGMFISPHLVTTRERFCINGRMISEREFVEAFNWLSDEIMAYRCTVPDYCPTYFERLFFMGIYVFARAGIDIMILETGLGGRLDTTNVIREPAVTVITEIGLDHMAYLGDTVEKIAAEKAGIIKAGVPVVFSDRKRATSEVIRRKAKELGCKDHAVSENDYKINEIQKKFIDFSVVSRYYDYGSLIADTTAVYQAENAAVAVRTCEILKKDCGFRKIAVKSIQEGIRKMRWACRMEEIRPGVFIDGAHNEDGIAAFVRSLKMSPDFSDQEDRKRCVLIFSAVRDKQYDKMIEMLCGLSMVTAFVITRIPGDRGANLAALREIFEKYANRNTQRIYTYDKIEDALAFGLSVRKDTDSVYIVGSLYLAGIVEGSMEDCDDKF
ncbi:MAG: bifunctional folylpolyglutamate synthase/dihydrofolate synthase [Lachnospiraceae bacterium]|nr:bifunctional folylpolyglutamate synthase/dihydrofolate synthase [Lachnospiraceae bacterium]